MTDLGSLLALLRDMPLSIRAAVVESCEPAALACRGLPPPSLGGSR